MNVNKLLKIALSIGKMSIGVGSVQGFQGKLIRSITSDKMSYTAPNFEYEWKEAVRYPEFVKMKKKGWLDLASAGFNTRYSTIKQMLGNVDLNFDSLDEAKKTRFTEAFKSQTIEMPIAVKFSDDHYDLVAGNTRLSGLVNAGLDPKIWIVDVSNLDETQ